MIKAIEENLQRGIKLLEAISDEDYSNCTIPPYYSSIGNNIRHILDVFLCVFEGIESNNIDFSCRKRNELAQKETQSGILYCKQIIEKLHLLNSEDYNKLIKVTDDLGKGLVTVDYTLISTLIQAHSHAIHHFAIIGFIINQLGIELPEPDFGYNPTTPKNVTVQ